MGKQARTPAQQRRVLELRRSNAATKIPSGKVYKRRDKYGRI